MVYNRRVQASFVMSLLALALLSPPLFADEKQNAKAAAREGQRLMDVGEYQAALDSLKRAYVAGEDVRLLYDIGECHRLLHHKEEAIQAYRTYLRKNPNADNTAEVETWIAELSGQPSAAKPAPPAAPAKPMTAPAPAVPAVAPAVAHAAPAIAAPAAARPRIVVVIPSPAPTARAD
jgi:tetratricopeptide (TPR) repeat protein